MKYLSIALILALSLGTSYAVTVDPELNPVITFNWIEPTTNTDTTAIKVPPPLGYQFYVKLPNSTKFEKAGNVVTGTTMKVTTTGLVDGTYIYANRAVNASGIESALSNTQEVIVLRPKRTPNAATGLTVSAP